MLGNIKCLRVFAQLVANTTFYLQFLSINLLEATKKKKKNKEKKYKVQGN